MPISINNIESNRLYLESCLSSLISTIGTIPIGKSSQFPFGWRKAAKGRTVWRIVEEIITQNLEKNHSSFGITQVLSPSSEVAVFDFHCICQSISSYINIKSAVIGGKKSKDDISKAEGLRNFFTEDPDRLFYIATFFIKFHESMAISIENVCLFPVMWLPDIYVNPSNNGNLQSSECKDISNAIKRTNADFLQLFDESINVAETKKKEKKKEKSKLQRINP